MAKKKHIPKPRPLLGLLAGLVAGIAASAAMEAFQAGASEAMSSSGDEGEDDDPTTVKAADRVMKTATGDKVPKGSRRQSGRAVHYATGATLGAIYGVVAEFKPAAASGFGSAYGVVTALVLDEGAVPALGLSSPPWKAPVSSHGYSVASHLVYGLTLEAARTLIGGRRPA